MINGFFGTFFFGVNVTFFPMHFTGLQGRPRKYMQSLQKFSFLASVSTYGALIANFGVYLFIATMIESIMAVRIILGNAKIITIPYIVVRCRFHTFLRGLKVTVLGPVAPHYALVEYR